MMNDELHFGLENGLSQEEHKWLSEQFTESRNNQLEQIKLLQEQMKILRRIHTTLQIVAVILLVSAILLSVQVLGL
jgi:hypothetical protein